MADISNPTKPWPICKRWTDLLFVEFFNQGDWERELGIDISFLMDRTTTNIAKAQDGFIKNLIKPAFVLLKMMLPYLELNIAYMDENIDKWASKVIEYSNLTHSPLESTNKNVPNKIINERISNSELLSNKEDREIDEEEKEEGGHSSKILSLNSSSKMEYVIFILFFLLHSLEILSILY